MREGDKWEVVIPSHLAYGASGTPFGNIGPNETLVFTIELVEVMEPVKKPEVK
jgi:FKBP-type peptidyl-prolyl cis-trans isomerase